MHPGRGERPSRRLGHGAPLAAIVLVVSAVALFLIYRFLPVLKLIAIALLLTLALRNVRGLERARFPTWLSAIVLLVSIGALVWLVMVPNLVEEFRQLASEGLGSLQSVANLFRDLPLFSDASRLSERLRGYLS